MHKGHAKLILNDLERVIAFMLKSHKEFLHCKLKKHETYHEFIGSTIISRWTMITSIINIFQRMILFNP